MGKKAMKECEDFLGRLKQSGFHISVCFLKIFIRYGRLNNGRDAEKNI